jgi:hypothetical protein
MFWTFKLIFDVDVLAFLAWRQFWLLFKKLGEFFKSSGHSATSITRWQCQTRERGAYILRSCKIINLLCPAM